MSSNEPRSHGVKRYPRESQEQRFAKRRKSSGDGITESESISVLNERKAVVSSVSDTLPVLQQSAAPSKLMDEMEYHNALLMSTTANERGKWEGFCEIESDPAYLNVMLEEFGVEGVRVQEVFSLDKEFMKDFAPTYGLVFLSQYQDFGVSSSENSCPEYVWFANQTAENACCTIALLNTVNNIPGIELGPHLRSFKDFTQDLSPPLRGHAISNWRYLKRVHNSFARKLDMLKTDVHLKGESDKWKRKKKRSRQVKAASATNSNSSKAIDADITGDECFPVYHYVAFVPIQGYLWRMDGMDKNPINLGTVDHRNWLDTITPLLQARMAQFEGSNIDFNLLALVKDTLVIKRQALALNIRMLQTIDMRLDEISPTWRNIFGIKLDEAGDKSPQLTLRGLSTGCGITAQMVAAAIAPTGSFRAITLDSDPNTLLDRREKLEEAQHALRTAVKAQDVITSSECRANREKAEERRHDYGGYISSHLRMLANIGVIEDIVKDAQVYRNASR